MPKPNEELPSEQQVIGKEEQESILTTVNAIAKQSGQTPEELETRRHLLMVGVLAGLGMKRIPPYWYMNIQAHATDRLFANR